VPVGATPGAEALTVKLRAVMPAGLMSSLKVAAMAALPGAPRVGPGIVVAGAVNATVGRVVSRVARVVKCQTNGAVMARPVARLVALVMVAV